MMQLADWLSPATLRVLALTLLHFLWQGAALAVVACSVMGLCRSASARYGVGVAALVLMLAAPVASFVVLRAQIESSAAMLAGDEPGAPVAVPNAPVLIRANHAPAQSENAPAYFLWLVEPWFAGVLLLSLRSLGGFVVVERLRRKETTPVASELEKLCLSLQRRMGLQRVVRYCESIHLHAPAVAGWIRPVVLLPISAISGLTTEQLEAVIAHELAHIQRHDAFVNLFQLAVETLLFYHPAVWWLGKRIRAERENCCDDVAVTLCESPITYANALARMAECQVAPQLVMAANGSPLIERIARLLETPRSAGSFRVANLGACVLCLLTALIAGSAFLSNVHHVQAQTESANAAPTPKTPTAPAARPVPAAAPVAGIDSQLAPADAPSAPGVTAPFLSGVTAPAALGTQQEPSTPKQSYIDALKEAGLTGLSVDELIGLKVQGVTGEYVKAMKDLGLKIEPDNLIGMKVQGITPEYVRGMRELFGPQLDSDALIGMKVQGVTADYVKQMRDLGLKTDSDSIIGMKVQGITPEYVRQMHDLGLRTDSDEIIGMKVQGITPEYVKSIQDLGFHPQADELVGMKVQGVDAAYLKGLQAEGFKVDIDEAIGAKVQGVTPEFVAKVQSHGFKGLTLEKIIALKVSGVLDEK
jgi:beta-lactamase regulating signal transducer with metallopeptidase domain/sporulation protein YlmC with PRC-barrel domain